MPLEQIINDIIAEFGPSSAATITEVLRERHPATLTGLWAFEIKKLRDLSSGDSNA
jgi:hypothetical protein